MKACQKYRVNPCGIAYIFSTVSAYFLATWFLLQLAPPVQPTPLTAQAAQAMSAKVQRKLTAEHKTRVDNKIKWNIWLGKTAIEFQKIPESVVADLRKRGFLVYAIPSGWYVTW